MIKSVICFVLFCALLICGAPAKDLISGENIKALDHLTAAAIFKESGEYDKAINILENSSFLKDDNDTQRYLGWLYFLSGREGIALKTFKEIKDKSWLDYLYLGLIYDNLEKYDLAIKNYSRSINIKNNTIALFRLAKIYRRKRDFKKATDLFYKVIENDSSIRIANFYLGECLLERGLNEEAYWKLSKASKFYPQNKEILNLLVLAKNKLGQEYFDLKKAEKNVKRQKVKLPSYIRDKDTPLVRVGIAQGLNDFSFSCQGEFTINDGLGSYKGKAGRIYTVKRKDNKLLLCDFQGKNKIKSFSSPMQIVSVENKGLSFPFYVLDIVFGKKEFWQKKIDRAYQGELTAVLVKNEFILINTLSIENYLKGVLSAEIPANSAKDALYAQAVAARTLAVRNRNRHKSKFFDFCSDVHCQVYHGLSARTKATDEAVDFTRGQIMTFNNEPIEAFYHSNCGGCLSADSFGKIEFLDAKLDLASGVIPDSPYIQEKWLINTPDTYSTSNVKSSFRWQRIYDREDFFHIFGLKLEDLEALNPKKKGDCFRYKEIEVKFGNKNIDLKGDLRIRNFFDHLRSGAFKSEIKFNHDHKPGFLIFWGGGFGHGAGMSQEGAINMARDEVPYQDILKHYYPKTELKIVY